MNINELDNFKLSKAIDFNDDLNPQIFANGKMRPDVREKLLKIADRFREFLGVEDIALVDIRVSGSNAAYSYTPHSDVDLHLIVDYSRLPQSDVYRELFDAKKNLFNDLHDIKIKGYNVELYVQSKDQPHASLGEYSVLNDEWTRIPTKQRANLNDIATVLKYEKLKELAIRALASDDEHFLTTVLDTIKRYRKAGLAEKGEFGPENLAFKMLRTDGYFEKLMAKKRSYEDKELSFENIDEDNIHDELAAEFEGRELPEKIIQKMYKARPSLFDEFDYNFIYDTAKGLAEASYPGNIGAMEMMKFYQVAPKEYIDVFKRLLAANKTQEAWQLVQKVTGAELKGKEFTIEGVGRIVKGVNTTPDVGVDQTKIEAAKLGFKVTKDGVPPLLRESRTILSELRMSPKHIAKEVAKIADTLKPIIGLEFEVCFEGATGNNPDVTKDTTLQDIKDFFDENRDDDFIELITQYEEWLWDKQSEWAQGKAEETAYSNPGYDIAKIIDIMENYNPTSDEEQWIKDFTNGEEDSLTSAVCRNIVQVVIKYIKEHGPMDEWELDEKSPPAIKMYNEIFEDNDNISLLREYFDEEFWNLEPYEDEEYSFGAWCLEYHIKDMHDVYLEWSGTLYWPGGGYYNAEFDYTLAEEIVGELQDAGFSAFTSEETDIKSDDDWIIMPDSSIKTDGDGDTGLEIVMPPYSYGEGIEIIDWFIDYLTDKGAYTNDTTGLHINVSLGNVEHAQLDYIKLILLSGDEHVLKQFGRQFNDYAVSSIKSLADMLNPQLGFERDREGKAVQYAALVSKLKNGANAAAKEIIDHAKFGKYSSVGFHENRIEFRAAGGDYLDKIDQILSTVNRFVYAYAIASDPNAYKNEYNKKLYKLAAKISDNPNKDVLTLFSSFSSGTITKEQLVKYLKQKKSSKVDQGPPKTERDAIDRIAAKYRVPENEAEMRWMEGVNIEMPKLNNLKKAHEVVYNNLIKNFYHYTENL